MHAKKEIFFFFLPALLVFMGYLNIREGEAGLPHLGGKGEAGDGEQTNDPRLPSLQPERSVLSDKRIPWSSTIHSILEIRTGILRFDRNRST